ncbi:MULTISPECIES: alkaline phosphatase [unclassified Azospirillum]|uniref:alkaline phosphatase D family protein n=1 Tax=unclassified Azospirillum TaxID=2630922 RepID=UPI001FCD9192|nr:MULTISPECIES: alkaline phosphatase D family protein [unclassified Azospirillum]
MMKPVLPAPLLATRRQLLRLAGGAAVAALAVPSMVRPAFGQMNFLDYPFQLGVASGDPWPDGFVIWTRLAPRPLEPDYGMAKEVILVNWEVSTDDQFKNIAAKGQAKAHPELGHAVHVEVTGLQPGRPYYYRFRCGGERSPQGVARTAPAAGAPLQKLRFGVVGCQNYEQGFFTAYNLLAREELDFVYHYGDYIYESGGRPFYFSRNTNRAEPTPRLTGLPESFSLDDYRRRYAVYKMDTDLQQAHMAASWITVWDDHEIVDNWVSDFDKDGTPPEIFRLRRAAAAQAYYEHMPLRRSSIPNGPDIQLFRRFTFGDLLDMHVLDTRQYRSDQPCNDGFRPACPAVDDPALTVLGDRQEAWLFDNMAKSTARWNSLAQQVMMMACDREPGPEDIRNMDSWDPYRVARKRLLRHLSDNNIRNTVVLTGDEHQNFAGDLKLDPMDPSTPVVATEFVVTSISSGGDGSDMRPNAKGMLAENPHIKLINDQRGYGICDVNHKRFEMEFKVLDKVTERGGKLSTRAKFAVDPKKPGVQKA